MNASPYRIAALQHGSTPHASGAPAIAAWIAARLGTPTTFVGGVGDDAAGELIRSTLMAAGVHTESVVTNAALPTATAYVEYFPDGSRAFEFHVAGTAATALVPADLADLPEQAQWVHVSGSAVLFGDPLADTVLEAVRRGRDAGATVSIDPNLRAELDDPVQRAALRELCLQADVLFPSEGRTGKPRPRRRHARLARRRRVRDDGRGRCARAPR